MTTSARIDATFRMYDRRVAPYVKRITSAPSPLNIRLHVNSHHPVFYAAYAVIELADELTAGTITHQQIRSAAREYPNAQ